MGPIRIVIFCIVFLAIANAINAQDTDEEKAIRKVLRDVSDAQNGRDFKAFGQFFAPDAEFVNVTAAYAKGREEIVKMHERTLNVVFKDIDFKALEARGPEPAVTVRFIRPDVAIVHRQLDPGDCVPCAAAAAAMHNPQPPKGSRQVMTWVLSKHGDRWLIDTVQNTVWSADPAKAPK